MKKLSMLMVVILSVFATACQKEEVRLEPQLVLVEKGMEIAKTNANARSGGFCKFSIEYGDKIWDPIAMDFFCNGAPDSWCEIHETCYPNPVDVLDICKIIPCGFDFLDPWIIYWNVKPEMFGSLRDYLKIEINPKFDAIPFAMNERILGLQLYDKNSLAYGDPEPQPNIQFDHSLRIDAYVAQELGLKGNVIPAGKYPVMINEKNGTFNVILAVKEGFSN
jgi:hypothetical protein